MATDRELLELAAKAAGFEVYEYQPDFPRGIRVRNEGKTFVWMPLIDDGDALRLAVALELSIDLFHDGVVVAWTTVDGQFPQLIEFDKPDDHGANTRRGIVRAAAEIGKTK